MINDDVVKCPLCGGFPRGTAPIVGVGRAGAHSQIGPRRKRHAAASGSIAAMPFLLFSFTHFSSFKAASRSSATRLNSGSDSLFELFPKLYLLSHEPPSFVSSHLSALVLPGPPK
jgi:hypothetical protein